MKKYPYFSTFVAITGALTLALPLITNAQTAVDTGAAVGIGESIDAGPNSGPMNLRDSLKQKIQQNYQTYNDNIKNNEDYRNTVMEGRKDSSTPPAVFGRPIHAINGDNNGENGNDRNGSSTKPFPGMRDGREGSSTHPFPEGMRGFSSTTYQGSDENRDNRGRMEKVHIKVFADMRNHFSEQLSHALDNLKQVRTRIGARIDTETQNGKDMSSAKLLLVTADAKISIAGQAILDLENFNPASTTISAGATTTTDIDLGKPREIGSNAIKAINDARKTLGDVVAAIAKSLGVTLDNNNQASTTHN